MEGPVVRIDVFKRAFRQFIRLASLALLPAVVAVASADTTLPQLSLINVINPILENNLQTLTVGVTDDVGVASVSVNIGGVTYPMTATGRPYQYSYSFRPGVSGIVTYSVVARDASSNIATLNGTFHVHVGQVDVCAWKGCKIGAASWSIDDGHTECRAKVEAAGFRGTFYYRQTEWGRGHAELVCPIYSRRTRNCGSHHQPPVRCTVLFAQLHSADSGSLLVFGLRGCCIS